MAETFAWWLILQLIGLAALPLCLTLFRRLPYAGYALSKPFGLIIGGYLFWILNVIHMLPNTQRGIAWALVFVAAGSALVVWRRRDELLDFLDRRWAFILVSEVLFTVTFVVAAYLRSYVPDIAGTEKPMDLMFINAATRSEYFPPDDPWLSGFSVSYYYFGYLLVAMVGKLAAIQTSIAYNLGLAMTAALAVTAAFGLVYDLVAGRKSEEERARSAFGLAGRPLLFGLAAGLILAVMGNLEGVLEFLAAHRIGWEGFWNWVDIEGLNASTESDAWYPTEHWHYWWWFRASRIMPGGEISEFPFFSFLLGDLHPHVMSIPFVLLTAGGALALFRSEEPLDIVYWLERPLVLAGLAVVLGGLAFLNTWDMPTLALVILAVVFIRNFLRVGAWRWGVLWDTLAFAVPLFVAACLAYVPFFFGGFDSQASGFSAVSGDGTRPFHLLLFWGPFAAIIVPFALSRLRAEGRWQVTLQSALWALAPGVAVVVVWLLWDALAAIAGWGPFGTITERVATIQLNEPEGSWADRIAERGANWVTAAILIGVLALMLLALWREMRSKALLSERRGAIFGLILAAVGTLLIVGTEFLFIMDTFASRMNTVFKLYYQAWLLLSLAAGFALYELFSGWRLRVEKGLLLRHAWALAVGLVLAAALLYPLGATYSRTNDFEGPRSLDGLASVQKHEPDEYAAFRWLAEHSGEDTVIAEAVGGDYNLTGRMAGRTGVPVVISWAGHEIQWRGSDFGGALAERESDLNRIFTSTDESETMTLLDKYGVTYVVVGTQEEEQYPPESLQKFEAMFEVTFRQGEVTIYRVSSQPQEEVQRAP